MDPFKDRRASREGLIHFFTRQFAGAPAIRLEFRADVRRGQSPKSFHGDAVKHACVFVAEQKLSVNTIKNHDRLRGVLDDGAELRFAGSERVRALLDASFE